MKKETEKKKKKMTLEEMAMNTANFEDEIVYRGFVQTGLDELDYEFDDRWVMIAPIGEYDGTTTTGEVVKEIFNVEDYEAIVFKFHEDGQELPLDRDHASMKQPLERDTQAYGWIYDLRLMSGGADDYNGLYAKFRWTDEGRNLVLSRAYRFLSPVFTLSEDGHPTSLVNVALTNRPNFDLPPIFNTEATKENPISEEHTMNIEELKNAIIDGVVEKLQTINTKPDETKEEEKKTCEEASKEGKKTCEETSKEEEKPVEVSKTDETETTEEKKTPCEEPSKEEEKEEKEEKKEPAETDDDDKEEKTEVITEEVMNTVPTSITPSINKI